MVGGANASSIPAVTAGPLLPPSSLIRRPVSASYERAFRPSGVWGKEGCGPYFVSLHDPRGEGGASRPVVQHPWQETAKTPAPDHIPFWFEPISSFGSSNFTTFNSTSVRFHLGPCLSSSRPPCAAGSRRVGSRSHGRPYGRGYIVPRASDTIACRGRKLLTEQEVTALALR